MQFEFYTEKINPKLYKKAISHYIIRTLGRQNYSHYREDLKLWVIKIYPSDQASDDPFFTDDGLAGHVGVNQVKMYVYDIPGDPALVNNFGIFSIELAHMLGLLLGWTERVPLRHDDKGGNVAGTKLAKFVAEIHDRAHEGKLYTLKFWFWDRKIRFLQRLQFRAVDFRDLV